MNVVWGIRWDRGLDRWGDAPSGGAILAMPTPTDPARTASVAVRAVNVRSRPLLFPPARLNGLILHLLRGVSGRGQAEVEPLGGGTAWSGATA
jgi:hypothetical protein